MKKNIYTIEQIRERIEPVMRSAPVKKAILFGSYAKGNASGVSDIDLFIDSEGALSGYSFFGLYDQLEKRLQKTVDLIEKVDLEEGSLLYEDILNDGVIVYEQNQV